MRSRLLAIVLVWLPSLLAWPAANAGNLSCSIASVSGINLTYTPGSLTPLQASGTVQINCAKSGTNIDTRYLEVATDRGLYPSASSNRAANGSARLSYGLWRDAAASSAWGDTTTSRIAATVTSGTATSLTLNWWLTASAQQPVSAGTYVDSVTVRLYQGSASNPALTDTSPLIATLPISLTVSTQCALSAVPGTVEFNYTSFQPAAANASTSFAVTCTNGAPYTLSLDATTGTLLGLTYALQLNVSGVRTGTGLPQSATINGTMAGGQSGDCAAASCSGSAVRTLTISY